LVGFQTLDAFVGFVHERRPSTLSSTLQHMFGPMKSLHLLPNPVYRRIQVKRLTGLTAKDLRALAETFVAERVFPAENGIVLERMKAHQENGDVVAIVSGGLSIYVRQYAASRGVPIAIATDLASNANGVCLGRIEGPDCIGRGKVAKLRKQIALDDFDLAESSAYSDSLSDRPLFGLVGRRYLVVNNTECRQLF
jgi:HAD superfamily hydrolase (TIGR01490 family)